MRHIRLTVIFIACAMLFPPLAIAAEKNAEKNNDPFQWFKKRGLKKTKEVAVETKKEPESAELTEEEKKLLQNMAKNSASVVKEPRETVRFVRAPFGTAPPKLPRQAPRLPITPPKDPALTVPHVPQAPPEPPKAFVLKESQIGAPESPVQKKQTP